MEKIQLYDNFKIDTEKCLDILKNHEYFEYYKRIHETDISKPAQDFSNFTGIISHKNWNIGGLHEKDIQLLAKADYEIGLWNCSKLFLDLLKINPELRRVNLCEEKDLFHIIMGIASTYNLDDIIFFIGDYGKLYGGTWINLVGEDFYINMHRALRKMDSSVNWTNLIEWIISPKTSKYITEEALKISV